MLRTVSLLLAFAGSTLGQFTPPPPNQSGLPVCDGRNHQTTNSQAWNLPGLVRVAVRYVPAQTLTVEGLEWFLPAPPGTGGTNWGTVAGTVGIRAHDPATNGPSQSVLASASYVVRGQGGLIIPPNPDQWFGAALDHRAQLQAGEVYWLTWRLGPPLDTDPGFINSVYLGVEDAPQGPDATPYALQGALAPLFGPVMGDHRMKVRVTAQICNPFGNPARVRVVGDRCGMPAPHLFAAGLPIVGSTDFKVGVRSFVAGQGVQVFAALGTMPSGIPLGGGCSLFLDPQSLQTFLSSGANPVFSGVTDQQGDFLVGIPIAQDPQLVGLVFGLQGLVIDPSGPLPLPGGGAAALTQALDLTIGN